MKFGQYELLERVAVGGMAEVYRGRVAGAEGFEKWVAIKRILPEFARDEHFISMMLTEARIHSALSHRNIVQIHDLGISEDGEYFIVLEYVEGHDLRAVMETATELGVQIPDSLALHIADELAQALHFAHELTGPDGQPLGIIHRDVSPSNVLISNSGEVKLSDFGIAKRRNDHSFVGSLKGNLVYMSPEQARRLPLDRRTDVFSLGAVLFEMLTGQKLREILDEVSGFRDVASGVVRSARELRPTIPDAYEALLARALASNPADRFQDAAAFGAAIRELGREQEAPVGPAEMKELIELLNPPRRARNPVERSKVIRLGPEVKALAAQGRIPARAQNRTDVGGDSAPVILAPGLVPAPLAPMAALSAMAKSVTGMSGTAISPMSGNGAAKSNPGSNGWADRAGKSLTDATPPPTPRPRAATAPFQPAPARAMQETPPPPVISPPGGATGATGGNVNGRGRGAPLDRAEAAIHALEYSAGSEMQPTPPPPVSVPPLPDASVPAPTPMPMSTLTGSPTNGAGVPTPPPRPNQPLDFAATDMATELSHSLPTPPPRSATATYPGFSSQGAQPAPSAGAPWTQAGHELRDPLAPVAGMLGGNRPSGQWPVGGLPAAASAAMAPVKRGGSSWLSAAVLILVVVSAAATVVHFKVMPLEVLAVWTKPATLFISSDPDGATISLDGRSLPEPTPTRVKVKRDRNDHTLEFTREGSLPVRTVARFDKTVALSEKVTLPAKPAPPPAPPPPPVAEPAPVAEIPSAAPFGALAMAADAPSSHHPAKAGKAAKGSARKAAKLASKKTAAKLAKKKHAKLSKKSGSKTSKSNTKTETSRAASAGSDVGEL